ncbi:hypothetical protein GO755_33725 [Spirosoma sp. HMF4905]|uniref:BLUF domain-containing protein n=1 Tax=Spirosoma arboris TaxID=2682092 RepID=A0A7K1SML0_9BACT|nr:hypothetical protein [Spirosoma arboris]
MKCCIVYTSCFRDLLSISELTQMRCQGQRTNQALGITGVLLYCNGSVIHVLEGSEAIVERQYKISQKDYRQSLIIQLYKRPIEHRCFSNWSMGYKTSSVSEFTHLMDLLPFLKDPYFPWPKQDNDVLSLLQIFYLTNYRN